MRQCVACGGEVGLITTPDGIVRPPRNSSRCAACRRLYNQSYYHSPIGRAKHWYASIQARCHNYDGKNPTYADIGCAVDYESFVSWAVNQLELFWRDRPAETPALDRIDP